MGGGSIRGSRRWRVRGNGRGDGVVVPESGAWAVHASGIRGFRRHIVCRSPICWVMWFGGSRGGGFYGCAGTGVKSGSVFCANSRYFREGAGVCAEGVDCAVMG